MFYNAIWDPWLIIGQLIVLLSSFYLLHGAWLCLFALAFGTPLQLGMLLSPASMRVMTSSGWPSLGAALLSAPAFGSLLLPLVGRAKQCLDFTLSVYALHTFFCMLYSSRFPWGWEWWGVHLVATIGAVVLGEYLCLQRELEAIPLSNEEREARERRAIQQAQSNAAQAGGNRVAAPAQGSSSSSGESASAHERAGLLGSSNSDQVTTTTIRLAPSNAFNV